MTDPTPEETQHAIALDNALLSLYCFIPTPGDDKAILDNARSVVDICFRAAVAAERELWSEPVTTVLRGFDEGVFVRNVKGDGESDWAIKLMPFVRALGVLAAAIRGGTDHV